MADEPNALQHEEIQHLLERGEAAGFLESTDVSELVDTLELDDSAAEQIQRELEERNIELVEV
ncbi:MAG: RNA polymerase sigma factor region1.1 domain-containing protein, partial [Gaiellaceae bacterium]